MHNSFWVIYLLFVHAKLLQLYYQDKRVSLVHLLPNSNGAPHMFLKLVRGTTNSISFETKYEVTRKIMHKVCRQVYEVMLFHSQAQSTLVNTSFTLLLTSNILAVLTKPFCETPQPLHCYYLKVFYKSMQKFEYFIFCYVLLQESSVLKNSYRKFRRC